MGGNSGKPGKKNCVHSTRIIDELRFSELPSNKKVTLAHLYIYFSKYATYGLRQWIKRCAIQWTKLLIPKIDTKGQFRCTTADKKKHKETSRPTNNQPKSCTTCPKINKSLHNELLLRNI